MEIVLHWWMVVIGLVLFPFLYIYIRTPSGYYDFQIDSMLVTLGCWVGALGIIIGHFFKG